MLNLPQLDPLKTWVLDDHLGITLCCQGNQLQLKYFDLTHETMKSKVVPIPHSQKIEDFVQDILSSAIVIKQGEIKEIIRPSHVWGFDNNKYGIKLHLGKNGDLICQFEWFKDKKPRGQQFNALESLRPSHRCHSETVHLIESTKVSSMKEFISLMKDFKVSALFLRTMKRETPDFEYSEKEQVFDDQIEKLTNEYDEQVQIEGAAIGHRHWVSIVNDNLFRPAFAQTSIGLKRLKIHACKTMNRQLLIRRNEKRMAAVANINTTAPFFIEIEPFCEKSRIDDKVLVSKFRWAVTLICYTGVCGNHASIIIEGLNNGKIDNHDDREYFMIKCDFNDTNKMDYKLWTESLFFEARTPCWKVSSEKGYNLFLNIKKQFEKVENKTEQLPFKLFYPDGKKTNNCTSWAIGHLKKAGIVDLESDIRWIDVLLPVMGKKYTKYGAHFNVFPNTHDLVDELDYSESTLNDKESL